MSGSIVVVALHDCVVELDTRGNKGPNQQRRSEDVAMEACRRADMAEAAFERLKEVLARAETDLAKVKANSTLEKERWWRW